MGKTRSFSLLISFFSYFSAVISHCSSMSESDGELSVGVPSPISPQQHYHLMTTASQNSQNSAGMEDVSPVNESQQNSKGYQPERDHSTNDSCSSGSVTSRNPTCARCKNHQIISPLKGHKRYCPTRHCLCELCKITIKKQKINAEQVAARRAQAQDEEMGLIKPTASGERPPAISVSSPSTTMSTRSISPSTRTSRVVLLEDQSTLRNDPLRLATYSAPISPIRPSAQQHQQVQQQQQHQQQQQQQQQQPTSATNLSCQPGPVVFSQHVSWGSILLGQNATMLRESLHHARLVPEELAVLEHDVRKARVVTDEVSHNLSEIHRELQTRLLQVGQFSSFPLRPPERNAGVVSAPSQFFPYSSNPAMYAHQFRPSVITGPRIENPASYNHFNPQGN